MRSTGVDFRSIPHPSTCHLECHLVRRISKLVTVSEQVTDLLFIRSPDDEVALTLLTYCPSRSHFPAGR